MKTVKFFIILIIFFYCSDLSYAQIHPRVLIKPDSITLIKQRVQNTSNVISHELYQTLRNKVLNWANEISPGTDHLYYTKYSNVAFMALLENDQNIANQWKDNMINLALNFDQNFYQPNNHPTGSCFHANFFTIATALIVMNV